MLIWYISFRFLKNYALVLKKIFEINNVLDAGMPQKMYHLFVVV